MGQDPKLYVSDATKAAMAPGDLLLLQKLLPQWGQRDIILISNADINAPVQGADGKFKMAAQPYTQDFRNFVAGLPLERQAAAPGDKGLTNAYVQAARGEFAANPMPGFKSASLVTTPVEYGTLNQKIPAGLAGLPASMLGNIPGSPADWLLATAAHESGHLSSIQSDAINAQRYQKNYAFADGESLQHTDQEITADRKGLSNYFNMKSQGVSFDNRVPQTFLDLRAIGTLRLSGDTLSARDLAVGDHSTSPALTISGNTVQSRPGVTAGGLSAAALDINTQAHLLLAIELAKANPDYMKKGKDSAKEVLDSLKHDPQLEQAAKENGYKLGDVMAMKVGEARYDLLTRISKDPKGREGMALLAAGDKIAEDKPLLEYAAVKFLYENHSFHSKEEERIAKEYIDAFEKHVPAASTSQMVKDFTAQLNADKDKIREAEKTFPGMKYIQESLDISARQLNPGTKPQPAPSAVVLGS